MTILNNDREDFNIESLINKNDALSDEKSIFNSSIDDNKKETIDDLMSSIDDFVLVNEDQELINNLRNYSVSDDRVQNALSNYSIDDVNSLLNSIITNENLNRKIRNRTVARIVRNQPHKTLDFTDYDKYNDDLINYGLLVFIFSFFSGLISIIVLLYGLGLLGYLMATISLTSIAIAFDVGKGKISNAFLRLNLAQHSDVYNDRSENTLKELSDLQSKMSGLNGHISDSFSKESIIDDFDEVTKRISSYETDVSKAIDYPSFNDVTIPEVYAMIKQLRKCRKIVNNIDNENLRDVSNEVDELWGLFNVAEETAKRIGVSSLSSGEVKLLNKIKSLLSHAEDTTYSSDVRANYYEQLRVTINKLNVNKSVVPQSVIQQIEKKTLLLAENDNQHKTTITQN